MKNFRSITYIVAAILLTGSTGHCINITKLGLKSIRVKNSTNQERSIKVDFQEKCATCPKLHGIYIKKYVIAPNKAKTIQDKTSVIKNIQSLEKSRYFNFSDKNEKLLTIQSKKIKDFPIHANFNTSLKESDEYKMLCKGHSDYVKSMPNGSNYKTFFKKLKKIYEKNNLEKKYSSTVTSKPAKISRIIHSIWFGRTQMPEQFKKWQNEWKDKHPKYIFILWNENRIKQKFPNGLANQKTYDEARMMYDYATMSKIVRYEILNKFGGVYVDPDVKCYETFEPLHHIYDFYAGLGTMYKTYGAINNGIIGARSGHPILKAAINYIKTCETKSGGLYDWTAKNLSMAPITEAVWKSIGYAENVDIIFPRSYFDANTVKKEFNHTDKIYEVSYEHINHKPETFCSRGVYSYTK